MMFLNHVSNSSSFRPRYFISNALLIFCTQPKCHRSQWLVNWESSSALHENRHCQSWSLTFPRTSFPASFLPFIKLSSPSFPSLHLGSFFFTMQCLTDKLTSRKFLSASMCSFVFFTSLLHFPDDSNSIALATFGKFFMMSSMLMSHIRSAPCSELFIIILPKPVSSLTVFGLHPFKIELFLHISKLLSSAVTLHMSSLANDL